MRCSTNNPIDQLQHEWRRLRRQPNAIAIAATWDVVAGPVVDLDQVLTAVGFQQPTSATHEAALARLVAAAHTDSLAARVVTQRLLPGALSMVRRRCMTHPGNSSVIVDEMLGALWIAIRTFNPDRRPACLAAALLDDAEFNAFRRPQRRRAASEVPTDTIGDRRASTAEIDPSVELATLLHEAETAGAVTPADADLVRRLATSRPDEVARSLAISARTVRLRRERATRLLRQVALA